MNILITGGAGFIGSHLCEILIKHNHSVISVDNYFTGTTENHVSGPLYINGSTENISDLLRGHSIDLVYHLGEYSRVEQSFDDIEKVIQYNKIGTLAVLEYVRKNDIKIIYAGSSTKFGNNGADATPYSWSKSSNTELVKNYGQWFGIKYAITYFYNVYGPREIENGKYATLIALFKNKYKNNLPLTVVLPGTQKRNFTHVYDIVDALVLIGLHGKGDGYGIGSPESYSIIEIAELFKSKHSIEFIPERRGNRQSADLITEKTKLLGWNAKRKLIDYIK